METYTRTTEYSTAASSLMLIINHLKPDFQLDTENEFRIWMSSVNLPTRACSIYGLAIFAKKLGLEPKIVLEEKEYEYPDYRFKGYTKQEIDQAKFASKLRHKDARAIGIPIEERTFDLEEVKRLVEKGHVILLRVNAGALRDKGSVSNYVVVYSYKDKFSMVDPVQGKITVGYERLQEAFETLVTKKKRDHRMIIF
ncbi:peptidase C39 family protein [Nanoarchaeota archaeon]